MTKITLRAAVVAVLSVGMLAGMVGSASAVSQFGGDQGCTPGYWKNHTSNWPGSIPTDDDFGNLRVTAPGATMGDIFGYTNMTNAGPAIAAYENTTLLAALSLKGGPGLDGAAQIEFRAAAAAWLNAADDRVDYLYRRNIDTPTLLSIRTQVRQSLGDRDSMLAVATALDNANNGVGGCPLS
jgi:hypothetical protein